jgi:hypothetical protein
MFAPVKLRAACRNRTDDLFITSASSQSPRVVPSSADSQVRGLVAANLMAWTGSLVGQPPPSWTRLPSASHCTERRVLEDRVGARQQDLLPAKCDPAPGPGIGPLDVLSGDVGQPGYGR